MQQNLNAEKIQFAKLSTKKFLPPASKTVKSNNKMHEFK